MEDISVKFTTIGFQYKDKKQLFTNLGERSLNIFLEMKMQIEMKTND